MSILGVSGRSNVWKDPLEKLAPQENAPSPATALRDAVRHGNASEGQQRLHSMLEWRAKRDLERGGEASVKRRDAFLSPTVRDLLPSYRKHVMNEMKGQRTPKGVEAPRQTSLRTKSKARRRLGEKTPAPTPKKPTERVKIVEEYPQTPSLTRGNRKRRFSAPSLTPGLIRSAARSEFRRSRMSRVQQTPLTAKVVLESDNGDLSPLSEGFRSLSPPPAFGRAHEASGWNHSAAWLSADPDSIGIALWIAGAAIGVASARPAPGLRPLHARAFAKWFATTASRAPPFLASLVEQIRPKNPSPRPPSPPPPVELFAGDLEPTTTTTTATFSTISPKVVPTPRRCSPKPQELTVVQPLPKTPLRTTSTSFQPLASGRYSSVRFWPMLVLAVVSFAYFFIGSSSMFFGGRLFSTTKNSPSPAYSMCVNSVCTYPKSRPSTHQHDVVFDRDIPPSFRFRMPARPHFFVVSRYANSPSVHQSTHRVVGPPRHLPYEPVHLFPTTTTTTSAPSQKAAAEPSSTPLKTIPPKQVPSVPDVKPVESASSSTTPLVSARTMLDAVFALCAIGVCIYVAWEPSINAMLQSSNSSSTTNNTQEMSFPDQDFDDLDTGFASPGVGFFETPTATPMPAKTPASHASVLDRGMRTVVRTAGRRRRQPTAFGDVATSKKSLRFADTLTSKTTTNTTKTPSRVHFANNDPMPTTKPQPIPQDHDETAEGGGSFVALKLTQAGGHGAPLAATPVRRSRRVRDRKQDKKALNNPRKPPANVEVEVDASEVVLTQGW